MEFEWDSDKAVVNLRKHSVSFEETTRVFGDPNRIETHDGREAYGEDRWKTVGHVAPVQSDVLARAQHAAEIDERMTVERESEFGR